MNRERLNYVRFFWRDYLAKTATLSLEEHGAYILMLCYAFEHGAIPPDDRSRARILRISEKRYAKKLKIPLESFFDAKGRNKRASEELEWSLNARRQKQIAGSAGGKKSSFLRLIKSPSVPK